MLLIVLIVVVSNTVIPSKADETSAISPKSLKPDTGVSSISSDSIVAGPLKTERMALSAKIQKANRLGIGIQPYLNAFVELENMVRQGSSQDSIQSRLNSIEHALIEQLSQQRKIILYYPPKTNNSRISNEPRKSIKLIPLQQARLFVLHLVNADRAKYHLAPVTIDSVATAAGQKHTDEMATVGYHSHWDTAGKKPWQRYTEAGGMHEDSENIASLSGNTLSSDHLFAPDELEQMESLFMSEKPPEDGHRLQILRSEHNKVGIGLSCLVDQNGQSHLCLAQEFIDQYGEYSKIPNKIERGEPFEVSGSLIQSMKLTLICIRWEPEPKPMTKEELALTDRCDESDIVVTEFYPDLEPEIVRLSTKNGYQQFSVRILPDASWKSGLYYISIWAKSSKFPNQFEVSNRTTHLE